MLKRRQDGRPKFPIFFKNRVKIVAFTVLGPRCLLEASKSLPRASREPPMSRSSTLRKHPRAAQSRLSSSQEASKRLSYLTPTPDACHTSHLAPDT